MRIWPFARKKHQVEQKGLETPDADLLALFGISSSGTAAVSASVALTVPAVTAAIRVISEAAATLDITVKADGEEIDHPAGDLLQGYANDWTSGFELVRDLTAQALTSDTGGLAWINRVGGTPAEIIRYEPGAIQVTYADSGTGEPSYKLGDNPLNPADVIHLRGPFAKCPLTLAREAIGLANAMERHAARLFMNGARPGGIIESPKPVGDNGVKKMIAAWRAAHDGPDNAGKTAVLWDGTTFKPLAFNSTDAQFLENRKFQILEIARAFRVPPSMLFELDRATWSNSEQMGREFLTYTLEPWLRALEAALGRALFTPDERRTHRIVFDRDDLTRADIGARATAYSTLVTARVLNPNEARKWEGLPPYEGGEAFANPAITPGTADKIGEAA